MMRKKPNLILILLLFVFSHHLQCHATSDGKGFIYIRHPIGIKTKSPNATVQINGELLIRDGSEGADRILRSDSNGESTWTPVYNFTDILTSNGSANNLTINNGKLIDTDFTGDTLFNGDLVTKEALNIGDTNVACDLSNQGKIRYSSSIDKHEFCTGLNWIELFNPI